MTNKEVLTRELHKEGLKLGCYDRSMEKVSKAQLKNVQQCVTHDYTDIPIKIRGKDFIVEMATVDGEVDFRLLSLEDYIKQYGRNPLEDEE